MSTLRESIESARERRGPLRRRLAAEGTDAYRLFHGPAEGRPGLTVDRYGPVHLVQTFREPLTVAELEQLEAALDLREDQGLVYNHRGEGESALVQPHAPDPRWLAPQVCREGGLLFEIRARHEGQDPLLFLDLRVGRRLIREQASGRSVLNLFAYTCGAGVAAAAGGARTVLNVDFSAGALEVGRRNAALNEIPPEHFNFLQEDAIPVLRQLAGLPVKGRGARRDYHKLPPRQFDLVLLDPPAWSTGPFGAVDVVRDYQSLFKPALLATAPGGMLIATNHVASVGREQWLASLRRCAEKSGRPLRELVCLAPEADFPSFDDEPPLKIAVCEA